MGFMTKMQVVFVFLFCSILFVASCENGTSKKIYPKDDQAGIDDDTFLADEDGLWPDEDEEEDGEPHDGDGTGDGDQTGKDDGGPKDDSAPADEDSTPDEDIVSPTCGDGWVDEGEVCDGGMRNCTEIDPLKYKAGKAKCLATCLGWDTTTCEEYEYECGNGIVEFPEVCDTPELTNCVEIDPTKYKAGKAYCLEDCSGFDTATCEEITEDDDIVPDPDTVDQDIIQPDTTDVQPDPDMVDFDYFEDDVMPDADADYDGPCGSVRLNGSTGYIEVPHHVALNLTGNWTIEAWVKQTTITSSAPIVRKGNASTSYPSYYLYGTYFSFLTEYPPYGGYYFDTSGNGSSTDAPTKPVTGEWYHIAMVKNVSGITVFLDGVAGPVSTASGDPLTNTSSLYFGTRQSSGTSYFTGLIDEIRISNIARYTSTFTPAKRLASDANTIGLWHFEEGSGTTAYNAVGTILNGSLVGGVTWESDCAAKETPVQPDDDVIPDADTVTPIVDTIGSAESSFSASNRMRGNFFSCTTNRTLTNIEMYLSYFGNATVYFDVYESTTLNGTYYPLQSFTRNLSMNGSGFYGTGPISVPLVSGRYYYIGARWLSQSIDYYNQYTTTPPTTAFGTWQAGMVWNDGNALANFLYSNTVNADYAYYQRLTTTP